MFMDFIRFVDLLCTKLFLNENVTTQKIMGQSLAVSEFANTFESLTHALYNMNDITNLSEVEAKDSVNIIEARE